MAANNTARRAPNLSVMARLSHCGQAAGADATYGQRRFSVVAHEQETHSGGAHAHTANCEELVAASKAGHVPLVLQLPQRRANVNSTANTAKGNTTRHP